jgi:hypothetical protein
MHGIKVLMAKNYIDNLSEEIKKGMLEKAEQSIYPSCAPLGYQNVMGPNGKRIIEPHPTQAPIIKQMFEWYATGQCSLAEVTKRATLAGLLSRRTGQVMSRSNVHRLLQSRVYTGDFDWNGRTYRGSHEPLISTALFERVQEILEGRYSTKEKVTKHEFTFSGLVHCGHCGCALVGEKKKANTFIITAQATKENAPNLMHEKKCLMRALPTYSRALCSMMKLWIGSSMPCIRATLTRNDLDVMRLLVYRTNKANYRTDLISSTTIGLTDLSNRISLSARRGSGDRLRSV